MTTDGKAEVSGQNQIPIDKEKLKEEQKAELKAITELLSSSAFYPIAPTGVGR